jgi:transposase
VTERADQREIEIRETTDMDGVRAFLLRRLQQGGAEAVIDLVMQLLADMQRKNTRLELRVMELLRQMFGRKGEGVSSAQLELFKLIAEGRGQPEGNEEKPEEQSRRRKAAPHGRRPFPPDLPTREEVSEVDDSARHCGACHGETKTVRWERSEMLEFVEGHFEIVVHKQEVVACKDSTCDSGVVTAPSIPRVIPGGMAGPGLLTHVILAKYQDHLPIDRLQRRFLRVHGVDLSTKTMGDWTQTIGRLFGPVAELIRRRAMDAYLLRIDATHYDMQDPADARGIKKCQLWCLRGDERYVSFQFTLKHNAREVASLLERRTGLVQADANSVFNILFTGAKPACVEIGCWMHGRRPFQKALANGDMRAVVAIDCIKRIYKIEEEADRAALPFEDRLARRIAESKPVVDELHAWADQLRAAEAPGTNMYKALTYLNNQRVALGRFLEDGRVGLDNGAVERDFKHIAVGRRNILFVGSEDAGRHMANIYSILATCRVHGINPREYLMDVLPKLAPGRSAGPLESLLPNVWKATRDTAASATE